MSSFRSRIPLSVLALLVFASAASAQTIGLIRHDPGTFAGYTLFEALDYPETFLIDNNGELVHSWTFSEYIKSAVYLQDNGDLMRAGSAGLHPAILGNGGGLIQRHDWDGNLLWSFQYADSTVLQHHDIEVLPNGNVLLLAREYKTGAEAIQAGRDPNQLLHGDLWPEHIVEVEPVGATGGNIVWEWHVWDHLIQDFDPTKDNFGVVADHPELFDINFIDDATANWMHANAVAYDASLDQIVLSSRKFDELWIIDHSTTAAEAAGHTGGLRGKGGDVLYRWGNPATYDRGTPSDQLLYKQHDTHWIPDGLTGAGRILIFNNGNERPEGDYSTVDELVTTADVNGDYPDPPAGMPHAPAAAAYSYVADPPESFYSHFISGAQRLANDNTLICQGNAGRLFEIDSTETIVWEYIVPVNVNGPMTQGTVPIGVENRTFRATRLALDHPAFDGRDLTPMGPIELPGVGVSEIAIASSAFALHPNRPNPFREETTLEFSLARAMPVRLDVFDVAGRRVESVVDEERGIGRHQVAWAARGLPAGVYHVTLRVGTEVRSRKMVVLR